MKNYIISDEELIIEWANACVDVDHLQDSVNTLRKLNEAVELPTEGDVFVQMAEVNKMMQAAKRGMGLTNKIKDPGKRAMHKSTVMSNMNRIRAAVKRIGKAVAAKQKEWRDELSGKPAPTKKDDSKKSA
jgi:hypothetical protein